MYASRLRQLAGELGLGELVEQLAPEVETGSTRVDGEVALVIDPQRDIDRVLALLD